MVYEAICPTHSASERQRQLAQLSSEIVTAFRSANFDGCIKAADNLEQFFGRTKFTELYRKLSQEYLAAPPQEFDGQVILVEK